MEIAKKIYYSLGLSRFIMSMFLLFLFVMVAVLGIDFNMALSDCLSRIGRNGLFVVAMLVSIK